MSTNIDDDETFTGGVVRVGAVRAGATCARRWIAIAALALGACASGPERRESVQPPAADAPRLHVSLTSETAPSQVEAGDLPFSRRLRAPEALPEDARQLLGDAMTRHGFELLWLLSAIVLLEYDDAEKAAREVARAEPIARPARGEWGTLASRLPPRFFALQDELRARAGALADAAHAHDDAHMSAEFQNMVQTCVSCHSAYLATGKKEDHL